MAIPNTANFAYQYQGGAYTESATSTVEEVVLPVVTMTKEADKTIVSSGDVILYKVIILLNNFTGTITHQVFTDILPDSLEFVEGSLTVDAEPHSGTPAQIDVSWGPNSEHLIMYQCRVL